MKAIEIKATKRENLGKKASASLRANNHVPCIMYGGGEIVHFAAHENDFRNLIYTPYVYVVNLDIDGKTYTSILQDIQFHPVTDKILHIDFMQVFDDRPVVTEIPVKLHGLADGVKEGGKLNLIQRKLKVKGLLKDLQDELDIKIDDVSLGQSIKIKDLEYKNLELLSPMGSVVLTVKLTRAAIAEEMEEEVAEEEEEETTESEQTEA